MARVTDSGAYQMQGIYPEGERDSRVGDDECLVKSAGAVGIALDFMNEYADVFEELAR